MVDFIKQKLVDMHKTTTTDKYGQVSKSNYTLSVFGDKKNDVVEYCRQNKNILSFSTYGSSFGTYVAFTILDGDIKNACSIALSKNQNYINNINSY